MKGLVGGTAEGKRLRELSRYYRVTDEAFTAET